MPKHIDPTIRRLLLLGLLNGMNPTGGL